MNWRVIVSLSAFGVAMGLATISLIPSNVEPLFWLVIFVICAYVIARRVASKFFLHGLVLSLVNSIWITASHVAFFDTYIANHPQEASMTASMPFSSHPRVLMLVIGPAIGAVTGVILGLFCLVASRFTRSSGRSN
jgi:hypothetical protein